MLSGQALKKLNRMLGFRMKLQVYIKLGSWISVSGLGKLNHPNVRCTGRWTNLCHSLNLLVCMSAFLISCLGKIGVSNVTLRGINKKEMNEAFGAFFTL